MHHRHFFGLALPLLAAAGAAQSISLVAPVAVTQTIELNSAPLFSATLPAGPMPQSGALSAGQANGPSASWSWSSAQDPTAIVCSLGWSCSASSSAFRFGVAPGEILLSLSAPAPVGGLLDISGELYGGAQFTPEVRVDVFDDGVIELTEAVLSSPLPVVLGPINVTLGPTPTLIRVRIAGTQEATGQALLRIRCRAVSSVAVNQWVTGCGGGYGATGTFAGDLSLAATPSVGEAFVGVLGLNLHPVAFPALTMPPAPLSCWLLPSQDVLLLFTTWTPQTIGIPAAVRPFSFWTQGVRVAPAGLTPSEAYFVIAY